MRDVFDFEPIWVDGVALLRLWIWALAVAVWTCWQMLVMGNYHRGRVCRLGLCWKDVSGKIGGTFLILDQSKSKALFCIFVFV